jgi:hypothetical protein
VPTLGTAVGEVAATGSAKAARWASRSRADERGGASWQVVFGRRNGRFLRSRSISQIFGLSTFQSQLKG